MGLIFISHDLRLVSSFCDRVIVMYAGKVVEELPASELGEPSIPTRAACSTACRRSAPTGTRCRCSTASRSGRYDRGDSHRQAGSHLRPLSCAERCQPRRRSRANPSGWSANPVRENRRCCSAIAGLAPVRFGHHHRQRQDARRQPRQGLLSRGADGLPGPLRFAASAPDRRPPAAGAAGHPRLRRRRKAHPAALDEVGLGLRLSASAIRTSSRAASASASRSPAR